MNNPNENENKTVSDFDEIINDIPSSALNTDATVPPVSNNQNIPTQPKPVMDNSPITKEENINVVDLPKFGAEASTLGTLKPDKQKSPVAMIVLFAVLILFIAFMPQIITLVNNVLGTNLNANNGVNLNNNNNTINDNTKIDTKDAEINSNTFYDINDTTSITIDNITLTNLKKNMVNTNYNISFTLTNPTITTYTFTKKLYLEFYDANNTFISRSLVSSSQSIAAGSSIDVTAYLSEDAYKNATKLEAVLRTADDYPAISIIGTTLTCKNATNNITYTFDDAGLIKILDVYTYVKGNDNTLYNNDLLTNRSIISRMDALTGVDAVLTENNTGFISSTVIDYSTAKYSELTYTTNYYDAKVAPKIISFENNAKGFTCN